MWKYIYTFIDSDLGLQWTQVLNIWNESLLINLFIAKWKLDARHFISSCTILFNVIFSYLRSFGIIHCLGTDFNKEKWCQKWAGTLCILSQPYVHCVFTKFWGFLVINSSRHDLLDCDTSCSLVDGQQHVAYLFRVKVSHSLESKGTWLWS
jgi:hypothetical protein